MPPRVASSFVATASAPPRRLPLPSTRATSSLSPSAAAPWRNNFSRGRSAGANSFIYYTRRHAGDRSSQLSAVGSRLSAVGTSGSPLSFFAGSRSVGGLSELPLHGSRERRQSRRIPRLTPGRDEQPPDQPCEHALDLNN